MYFFFNEILGLWGAQLSKSKQVDMRVHVDVVEEAHELVWLLMIIVEIKVSNFNKSIALYN